MAISSKKLFAETYGYESQEHFFAPGRANIIGEYTDIAGGSVLPFAIDLGIDAHLSFRKDRTVNVFSLGEKCSFSLDNLVKGESKWLDYVIGVFYTFKKHGVEIPFGFDCALASDLPTASGLSSSAALEVLFGTIIASAAEREVTQWDIVKYAKETENDFIGLSSGIMDQFACEFGRKGQAMKLDTASLEYSYVPLELGNCSLVIMASNKSRALAESKYNDRVREVRQGMDDLKPLVGNIPACHLSLNDLEKYKSHMTNPDSYKRIRHLASEQVRVEKASQYLSQGNMEAFGKILYEGHLSMRDDFCSTGIELDTLVDLAMKNGAKGARMTGAGFGGCAIFLSLTADVKQIVNAVKKGYKKALNKVCDCYPAVPSQGAHQEDMD